MARAAVPVLDDGSLKDVKKRFLKDFNKKVEKNLVVS